MSDKVLMPKKLTAENGAKYALSGEFYETVEMPCQWCDDGVDSDGSPCDACNGSGLHQHTVYISWTNIKKIYAVAVKTLGEEIETEAPK